MQFTVGTCYVPVPAAYAGVLNVLNVGVTGFAALELTFPQ